MFAVRWAWISDAVTDEVAVVSDAEPGEREALIIRREVVAGEMPKRRKDSAIYLRWVSVSDMMGKG
jgi:hypothetical protein